MNVTDLLGVPGIEDDLAQIERALVEATATADPFLAEVAGHLAGAGGKRLRPALTTACARAAGAPVTEGVVMGGVACELVHLGSLYHDDVMDEADSRRGVESVNQRWGNLVAILAGDFLMARASEIAASLGSNVAGLLAATIGRLCEGQVGELQTAFNVDRTEDDYLRSINGKTASLTAAACRVGGIVAGLPQASVDALATFGEALGMVFQIRDDILDVVATESELGKPSGQDLVEGTYTLPVIRALADPEAGPELRSLLGGPVDTTERDRARKIVRESGAIEAAAVVAHEWATKAEVALFPLGDRATSASLSGAARRLAATIPTG